MELKEMDKDLAKQLYFIRLTDNHNAYVHPIPGSTEFYVGEGMVKAAVWDKENGQRFLNSVRANNLEMINCYDLVFGKEEDNG
jgi:hypothetical protein